MDTAAFDAWDKMPQEERRRLFVGMYTYIQIEDPVWMFQLEMMTREAEL